MALYGQQEHGMRCCILQVYICLSSVDSHQHLFQLRIARCLKKNRKKKKNNMASYATKRSGLCFLCTGREVNMKLGLG